MSENSKNKITIESTIEAPIEKVWEYFNAPDHIVKWNSASPDWRTPRAENDLRVGGTFNYRMEAKDGSAGFDFTGTYTEIISHQKIAYTMDDGRKVEAIFESLEGKAKATITFDPETENLIEMQRAGWQSILDNFKKYTETYY